MRRLDARTAKGGMRVKVELYDILDLLDGYTDVDVVQDGVIVLKVKWSDRYWEDDECRALFKAEVEYITAKDYRIIAVGI